MLSHDHFSPTVPSRFTEQMEEYQNGLLKGSQRLSSRRFDVWSVTMRAYRFPLGARDLTNDDLAAVVRAGNGVAVARMVAFA